MTSVSNLTSSPNLSFGAAGNPTASIVGAQIDDLYQNASSGEMFRCKVATFGAQEWKGSQGTAAP